MAKRLKIGLVFSYNENWVAGSYYILNLIQALRLLPDNEKPELLIISNSISEFEIVKNTGYPYLLYKEFQDQDLWPSYSFFERIINKGARMLGGKNVFHREQTRKRLKVNADLVFPAIDSPFFFSVKKKVFWIPDFQEHFLPHFFPKQQVESRKQFQQKLADDPSTLLVLSSNDALANFKTFYPDSKARIFVLPFAVTHPDFKDIPLATLLRKYAIDRPYFFCPNQFWAHKNHITLLKAISIIKNGGNNSILVVFSGKESDPRNPGLFGDLQQFIKDNGLEDNVRFLGFIDRGDQLQLIKNSIAVIQPSLFEGWSTVVEDAKALNSNILASSLSVHREQLNGSALFFDPHNAEELAATINAFDPVTYKAPGHDYNKDREKFGRTFIEIVRQIAAVR